MSGSSTKLGFRQRIRAHFETRNRASSAVHSSSSSANTVPTTTIQPFSSSSSTLYPSPLVSSGSPATNPIPSLRHQSGSDLPTNDDILTRTLQRLSNDERATLGHQFLSNSQDVGMALDDALRAAKEKQRYCVEKKWTFTFGGRSITLNDEAEKIIGWLDRFKAVGDIAANADPVHAGLPWAGIRLLLEAATSERNQTAALLAGCETSLYMANRLKAYIDYLHTLPTTLTRTNFETAVIELYAHILRFLARAITVYQDSTIHRAFMAFWTTSDLQSFETDCDRTALRVDIEANNCDRTLSAQDRAHATQGGQELQKVLRELEQHHKMQGSLNRIETKIDLSKLPYVAGALFNSYQEAHVTCHPNTRVDLLRQVQNWAQQPYGKRIFWLNGEAGTGKSTISRTFAGWLTHQGRVEAIDLGASFFFKRGEADRGSAMKFFPTLIHQLVLKLPGLGTLIAEVINRDPLLCDKSLSEQFDKLIYAPLKQLNLTRNSTTFVVVVDALDECEKEEDIKAILQLWSRLPQITTVDIRLFLTSRPELPIRLGFKDMSADAHRDVFLREIPLTTVQRDIWVFLKDEFSRIRQSYNAEPPSGTLLPDEWPGDTVLLTLAKMAAPLFIVGATICRFLSDPAWDAREQLETLLKYQGTGQLSQMEQMYLPVLKQLSRDSRGQERPDAEQNRLYEECRTIVGSIVLLVSPLSRSSLAVLLDMPQATIAIRLRSLHSVLNIPVDPEQPIRTLHLSFGEFLLSNKVQDKPFGVDGPATHRMLLSRCLNLLSGRDGLQENMCGIEYPGQPRKEKHLLHWLEALSLMNGFTKVLGYLGILQSLLIQSGRLIDSTQLSAFLEDARRFVLANRYIADDAPLQLYSSALLFAPQTSIVRNTCGHVPKWIGLCPVAPTWADIELQEHDRVSLNELVYASVSSDRTIGLFHPVTGRRLPELKGHIRAVVFSPDGSMLASASLDQTVKLWNPTTCQQVLELEGHTGTVSAVVFSPDGSLLASASDDRTARLWNPITGHKVQKLEGHTSVVSAVVFSPDGSLLASASYDKTIRLWNPTTGQEVLKLKGHNDWVRAVAFSQDGLLLASASHDRTVRLWNPNTGQEVQKLGGHTHWVKTVAFSQDGLLASVSVDQTFRLWNPTTGQEIKRFEDIPVVTTISPTHDNMLWVTNLGVLNLNEGSVSPQAPQLGTDRSMILTHNWIRQGTRKILWLPYDYRSYVTAFQDNTFAIGRRSGEVAFIGLDGSWGMA
ncbi:MAG: hypothetical protein Q9211_001490 [Gyalolechia sp. 1 TL-2023]